jgi:hypothetical protein
VLVQRRCRAPSSKIVGVKGFEGRMGVLEPKARLACRKICKQQIGDSFFVYGATFPAHRFRQGGAPRRRERWSFQCFAFRRREIDRKCLLIKLIQSMNPHVFGLFFPAPLERQNLNLRLLVPNVLAL